MQKYWSSAALALILSFFALVSPANATAFAGVQYAFWGVTFDSYYNGVEFLPAPAGIEGLTSHQNSLHLTITNNHAGLIDRSAFATNTFTITNTTDETFPGILFFETGASAFTGGGASVTDPGEWASFESYVFVADNNSDFHSCYVAFESGPASCGVSSPDSNDNDWLLPVLGPHGTDSFTAQIGIEADTYSPQLDEADTLWLLAASLAAAGWIGLFRKSRKFTA